MSRIGRVQTIGIMQHTVRRAVPLSLLLVVLADWPARGQFVVTDPAVTLRNSISAALQEYVFNTQRDQRQQVRRMARRLGEFTNLGKYRVTDVPRWRHHNVVDADAVLFARDYHAALNYGDSSGAGHIGVSVPVIDVRSISDEGVSLAAVRALAARLATIELADATAIAAINGAGRVRYNGRFDIRAIDALEAHVIDPSLEQSATAVLDKISGAALIGAKQRQARAQMLSGLVEQLLVETKRARDTDAAAINMQLTTWRDAKAANDAFVTGTGDALRTWRQP
jgi:hypothetical protein